MRRKTGEVRGLKRREQANDWGGGLFPEARRRSGVVNRRDISYLESSPQNQTFVRHFPHTPELEERTAVAKIGLETLAVATKPALEDRGWNKLT